MTNTTTSNSIPMASLYVGDLHTDINEAMLYEKFSQCGPILSIRVCRDMITRKSLGYAYVNYQNIADAEKAIEELNFENMKGNSIRIMWSQRDPSLRKSGVGNIFIKNLDKGITQKELYDTFIAFGNILSCKIANDENKKSKGYGFVHFESEDAANSSIDSINGMLINNKKVYVGKFIPKVKRNIDDLNIKFTNCYVKHFDETMSDEELKHMFEEFGEITSAKIMTDDQNKSKGFAFVCYKNPESAEKAVQALNNKLIKDKVIFVGRAQKKSERIEDLRQRFERQKMDRQVNFVQGVNLYIKNLDDSIDDDKLTDEFKIFGKITSAKVMTDQSNRSKGFGFVCFSKPEEATKAVTEMNGKICGSKPLYVALAQRKEDRKAFLTQQYLQRLIQLRGQIGIGSNGNMMNVQNSNLAERTNILQQQSLINNNPQKFYPMQALQPSIGSNRFYLPSNPIMPYLNHNGIQPRWNQSNLANNAMISNAYNLQAVRQAAHNNVMKLQTDQHNGLSSNFSPSEVTAAAMRAAAAAVVANPQVAAAVVANQQMQMAMAANAAAANKRPISNGNSMQAKKTAYQLNKQLMHNMNGIMSNGDDRNILAPQNMNTLDKDGQISLMNKDSSLVPINSKILADAQPQEQKQMLGDRLYPLVYKNYPELAGKITGMLLEIDNSELLHMLESKESLQAKVEEAISVLKSNKIITDDDTRINNCPSINSDIENPVMIAAN